MDACAYNGIKTSYKELNCWGMSCNLDVKNCDPKLIRSAYDIEQFVVKLCDLIQMKRHGCTQVVHFGEDERVAGYSMIQLIETSLISGHFANCDNSAYIDIFSCKIYSPYAAGEFAKEFFKGSEVKVQISYRK